MMENNYKKYNAKEVLKQVNYLLNCYEYKDKYKYGFIHNKGYNMQQIYKDLSIFDWWKDYLSITNLKDMKKFLELALELGFNGYVCFKVGAKYCSNGMWAHKEESTDGYSPKGDYIYKSFVNEYNYYSINKNGETYPNENNYNSIKTIRDFKKLISDLEV